MRFASVAIVLLLAAHAAAQTTTGYGLDGAYSTGSEWNYETGQLELGPGETAGTEWYLVNTLGGIYQITLNVPAAPSPAAASATIYVEWIKPDGTAGSVTATLTPSAGYNYAWVPNAHIADGSLVYGYMEFTAPGWVCVGNLTLRRIGRLPPEERSGAGNAAPPEWEEEWDASGWDDLSWHPTGGLTWGSHWSGTGAHGNLQLYNEPFNTPTEITSIKVRIRSWGPAGPAGLSDNDITTSPYGCNAIEMTLDVLESRPPRETEIGLGYTDPQIGMYTVKVYIGRNGYGRINNVTVGRQLQRVHAGIFAACAGNGYPYYPGGTSWYFHEEAAEEAPPWVAVIDRLAESTQTLNDFKALIPRCPSGVWDNDGSSGEGEGSGTDPLPTDEELEDDDKDGDGVPDYKDADPDNPDIGETFDFADFRDYLQGMLPQWEWDFDDENLTTDNGQWMLTFNIPGLGPRNFYITSNLDTADPLQAQVNEVRILVRTLLVALFALQVFGWIISDVQEL